MASQATSPLRVGQVLEISFPTFTPRITIHSERELTVESLPVTMSVAQVLRSRADQQGADRNRGGRAHQCPVRHRTRDQRLDPAGARRTLPLVIHSAALPN